MYEKGLGVQTNYEQALGWYRKAAALGNGEAEDNLGDMYADGLGVTRDRQQALDWYRKGAAQGNADAQRALDEMRQPAAAGRR
jgi:hypothetical protein